MMGVLVLLLWIYGQQDLRLWDPAGQQPSKSFFVGEIALK
jgi:hypothetical protein